MFYSFFVIFSVKKFIGAKMCFRHREISRVRAFFFNPENGKLSGILAENHHFFSAENCHFHRDFVELFSPKKSPKVGKNLFSFFVFGISGKNFGRVGDLFFEKVDGKLSKIVAEKRFLGILISRKIFSAEKILRFQKTKIIVDDDSREKIAEKCFSPAINF